MTKTSPIQNILVGVDGELSAPAIVQAHTLAQRLGARVDLVHAVDVPPSLWPGFGERELARMHDQTLQRGRREACATLESALSDAGLPGELLEKNLSVLPGRPAPMILLKADELRSDLIVLGAHGKGSLFPFGGTLRAVLSHALVPVWRQTGPVERIRKILVPMDFSDESRRALEHACQLARCLDATINVLHCFSPPVFAYSEDAPEPTYVVDTARDSAREELAEAMDDRDWAGIVADADFAEGEVVEEIMKRTTPVDLVVMGTHGRTGLSRFLLGSVAHGVLSRSRRPVLAVPSASRTWHLGQDPGAPAS